MHLVAFSSSQRSQFHRPDPQQRPDIHSSKCGHAHPSIHYTIYTDTCTHTYTQTLSAFTHKHTVQTPPYAHTSLTVKKTWIWWQWEGDRGTERETDKQTGRQTQGHTIDRGKERLTERKGRDLQTERTVGSNTHQSSLAYLADAVTEGLHAACAVELNDFMTVLVCSLTKGNIIWSTPQVILCVHVCTSPDQTPVCTNNGVVLFYL